MNEGIHLDLDTWIVPGQIRDEPIVINYYNCCIMLYIAYQYRSSIN